jgi:dTDP-4-dehydrorhamnose 3,5-epimerase
MGSGYSSRAGWAHPREHGVHPLDPDVGIGWPGGIDPVLSEKDAAAPGLEEALALGLLPGYRECVGYAARMGGC